MVVDVFHPIDAIIQVAKEFRQQYPGVALRIYVEALGGAIKPVLDGRCSIGVIGSLPEIPDTLTTERLPGITFLLVTARNHPLTSYQGKISKGPLLEASFFAQRLSVLPIEDVPPDGLILDVGYVAGQLTAWPRWPMVYRSPEGNSGGNAQSAETAGHQEKGEAVCENLARRRCPYRKK